MSKLDTWLLSAESHAVGSGGDGFDESTWRSSPFDRLSSYQEFDPVPDLHLFELPWSEDAARRLGLPQETTTHWSSFDDSKADMLRIFVFAFGDADHRDFVESMGLPPVDGLLVVAAAVADEDRVVPFDVRWVGRLLDPAELVGLCDRAFSFLDGLRPAVSRPAPTLPESFLSALRDARAGLDPRGNVLLPELALLPDVAFLEALDRMVPWVGPGSGVSSPGTLRWTLSSPEINDRTFALVDDLDLPGGKGRTAPWKSGVGNPRHGSQAVLEKVPRSGRTSGRSLVVFRRTPDGGTRAEQVGR